MLRTLLLALVFLAPLLGGARVVVHERPFLAPSGADFVRFTRADSPSDTCSDMGFDSSTDNNSCLNRRFNGDDPSSLTVDETGVTHTTAQAYEVLFTLTVVADNGATTGTRPVVEIRNSSKGVCAVEVNSDSMPASVFFSTDSDVATATDTGITLAAGESLAGSIVYIPFDGSCVLFLDPPSGLPGEAAIQYLVRTESAVAGQTVDAVRLSNGLGRTELFLANVSGCPGRCYRAPGGPSVLVLVPDDMGREMAPEVYGDVAKIDPARTALATLSTPNLDTMAGGGVTLNRAHNEPLCGPEKTVFFTGQSRFRSRAHPSSVCVGNGGDCNGSQVSQDYKTLVEAIRDMGIRTAGFGKLGLSCQSATTGHATCTEDEDYDVKPWNFGFDYYEGLQGNSLADYGSYALPRSRANAQSQVNVYSGGTDPHDTVRMTADVIRDILLYPDQSFRWAHYHAIHKSWHDPTGSRPWSSCGAESTAEQEVCLREMTEQLDSMLADILTYYDTSTHYLIYRSDDGTASGDFPGLMETNNPTRCPAGFGKSSIEECALSVALVQGPEIPSGEVRERLIVSADWYPTILVGMLGGTLPTTDDASNAIVFDGVNVLPYLEDGADANAPSRPFWIDGFREPTYATDAWELWHATSPVKAAFGEGGAPYTVWQYPDETQDLTSDPIGDYMVGLGEGQTQAWQLLDWSWCSDGTTERSSALGWPASHRCESFEFPESDCDDLVSIGYFSGSADCANTSSPMSGVYDAELDGLNEWIAFQALGNGDDATSMGCTPGATCRAIGIANLSGMTGEAEVIGFWDSGAAALVCGGRVSDDNNQLTAFRTGVAGVPTRTGSWSEGSHLICLEYIGASGTCSIFADPVGGTPCSGATASSHEAGGTLTEYPDELWLGSSTAFTQRWDNVSVTAIPENVASDGMQEGLDAFGYTLATNFEHDRTCTQLGALGYSAPSEDACNLEAAAIEGVMGFRHASTSSYWYWDLADCNSLSTGEACEVDLLLRFTSKGGSGTITGFLDVWHDGSGGGAAAQCGLAVTAVGSGGVLRITGAAGGSVDGSLVPSEGTDYRVRMHITEGGGTDSCTAWVDPLDGAFGYGKIDKITGTGTLNSGDLELWLSDGVSSGDAVVDIDSVRARKVPAL